MERAEVRHPLFERLEKKRLFFSVLLQCTIKEMQQLCKICCIQSRCELSLRSWVMRLSFCQQTFQLVFHSSNITEFDAVGFMCSSFIKKDRYSNLKLQEVKSGKQSCTAPRSRCERNTKQNWSARIKCTVMYKKKEKKRKLEANPVILGTKQISYFTSTLCSSWKTFKLKTGHSYNMNTKTNSKLFISLNR